jgi:carnitine 3-dehydrogenase
VAMPDPTPDTAAPMEMARMQVLPGWIDYNGHMTESRYLFAASETSDAFLRHIGADMDYVAGGHSYYTAETHIRTGRGQAGRPLTGTVQVLQADEKRLHVFIRILKRRHPGGHAGTDALACGHGRGPRLPCGAAVLDRLMPIAAAHAALPRPEGAGRVSSDRGKADAFRPDRRTAPDRRHDPRLCGSRALPA